MVMQDTCTDFEAVKALAIRHIWSAESHVEMVMSVAFAAVGIPAPWRMVSQHEVIVDGNGYRLDFAFFAGKHMVAVEVDGHQFHERTAEQVIRDNDRTMALQGAGWTVTRLSGSQVWRSAIGEATKVVVLLRKQVAPVVSALPVPPGASDIIKKIRDAAERGDVAEEDRLLADVQERARKRRGLST